MKWNWGTGIFLFFICFVGTLVCVFVQSRKVDNSLVLDKYYDEDLKYQEMYEKKQNTAALPQPVRVEMHAASQKIVFSFPAEMQQVSGTVWLYNPAAKEQDVKREIQTDSSGRFEVAYPPAAFGRWKAKLDWQGSGIPYYQEEELIF